MPVDIDSRLQLVRVDDTVSPAVEPVFIPRVAEQLNQLVGERQNRQKLSAAHLNPTRTALFVGEPGVGKTLAAKWMARELKVPLLTLDLAAVMSSFLGRTGNNVRYVLDYAKSMDCILLLDELDAVAKRRDDASEVGELKRLVTVLLQEVDDWPPDSMLLAATNHPDLLDPAVWRRFEMVVEFPKPEGPALEVAIQRFLGKKLDPTQKWSRLLAPVFAGASFSDIEREISATRRAIALRELPTGEALMSLIEKRVHAISKAERASLAATVVQMEVLSQRQANEIFGTSRDTIRKVIRDQAQNRNRSK
jgi:SpoVK/Ycf46/Vps4 family AAA+-type ATPase